MKRGLIILLFAFVQIFSCSNVYGSDNMLRLYKAAVKNDIEKYNKVKTLIDESGDLIYYISDKLLVNWVDKAFHILTTGDTTGVGYCDWWYEYNVRIISPSIRPYMIDLKKNIDNITIK